VTNRIYQIGQGTPVVAESTVQLLSAGLTGSKGAKRRLVHPDSATHPTLTYYKNPDRTVNFDQDILRHPIASAIRTIGGTVVVRFEELDEDVIVSEVWEAGGGFSMPVFQFRDLYNLFLNPPAFAAVGQLYTRWEPRDETDDAYHVELLDLQVGGGGLGKFDVKKWCADGGPNDPNLPGAIANPLDSLDVSPTALIDQQVTLVLRIVEKV